MIWYGHYVSLTTALLFTLWLTAGTTELGAELEILPPAYLPNVTQSIQLTCRPPPPPRNIAQVISMELFKQHAQELSSDPVASYVTAHSSPVMEVLGVRLGASVSGSYDPSRPDAASLAVTLPQPTDAADGVYSCVVQTLDSQGLLHDYHAQSALVSLAKNESVPDFYQALLKELRSDLDSLTSDFNTVQRSQAALNATDNEVETKLSAITSSHDKMTGYVNDIHAHFNVIDQANSSLHSQLDNLRALTPTSPVHFYAVLTSSSVAPSNGHAVVFNYRRTQSADNSYSTSTGCFTAPVNGTFFFRTSLVGNTNTHTFASLQVNGKPVASLHAYDDYSFPQASAEAVVELVTGDAVCVVKKSGSNIYGSYSYMNYVSYLMGVLLW
ncbi:hypothetical protein ACOMHN_019915 [Nucella lapillus]